MKVEVGDIVRNSGGKSAALFTHPETGVEGAVEWHRCSVFLDDEPVANCYAADEEEGWVDIRVPWAFGEEAIPTLVWNRNRPPLARKSGRVRIEVNMTGTHGKMSYAKEEV